MKMLLLFLLIGLYSFGQNKPKVIHHKKIDTKIEYRTVSDSDRIEVTPPAPPPFGNNIAIDPQIMEEEALAKSDIVEFPDVEATFPCHTFYSYDTLGNVTGREEHCGLSGMMVWINKNVRYPQTAIEMGEQGRVFISFVVDKDGSITNVKVIRGVSKDLDKEAQRIIEIMPKWVPAEIKGKAVRSMYRLPVQFRLN
jgi:protein TonB